MSPLQFILLHLLSETTPMSASALARLFHGKLEPTQAQTEPTLRALWADGLVDVRGAASAGGSVANEWVRTAKGTVALASERVVE